jgi:hypothetical protein
MFGRDASVGALDDVAFCMRRLERVDAKHVRPCMNAIMLPLAGTAARAREARAEYVAFRRFFELSPSMPSPSRAPHKIFYSNICAFFCMTTLRAPRMQ